MATRPPWYAFSYRLLGAHGTFWLLLLAIVAMLWTWHGAFVRVVDQEPAERTVSGVLSKRDLHRWFVLSGVRIVLDDALLGRAGAGEAKPSAILVDSADPAAEFWSRARAAADTAAQGSGASIGEKQARKAVEDAYVTVSKARQAGSFQDVLPRPQAAILLLGDEDGEASVTSALPAAIGSGALPLPAGTGKGSDPGTAPPGDPIEAYERGLLAWRDVVRARVSVASVRGLLDDAPPSVLDRLERNPGVRLGSRALRVDCKPRDLELYVFSAATLAFVFLAAGIWGTGAWQRERRSGDASPPPTVTSQ